VTEILAPRRLEPDHDLSLFHNGKHLSLDDWLRRSAPASEGLSARTYVICPAASPKRVIGYYAISSALVGRQGLPSAKLRQGTPEEVPALLIGRLAIDRDWQGRGLGGALLADALERCLAASEIAGARAVIVHAIDDEAMVFYRKHGFIASPLGDRVLLMPIEAARTLMKP